MAPIDKFLEKLELIDAIHHLCAAYHFQCDIGQGLQQMHKYHYNCDD